MPSEVIEKRNSIRLKAWWANNDDNVLLCACLLVVDRNWRIFFTYIKEHISYNTVYLILVCVNLRNNEIETINTS